MTDRFDDLPAMRELRSRLQQAAIQEHPSAAPRRSFAPRHRLAIAAVIALVVAAGATAASLLSTGKPVREPSGKSARYSSHGGLPAAVVTAPDTGGALSWGIAIYTAASGQQCAVVGQLRGQTLGLYDAGRFHPYSKNVSGPCDDLGVRSQFHDVRWFAAARRTLVYGRVREPAHEVRLSVGDRRYQARVGRGGAFLFVFKGRLGLAGLKIAAD